MFQQATERIRTSAARMPNLGDILVELAGDFVSGRPLDVGRIGQAFSDLGVNLGGIFGGQFAYSPPTADVDMDDVSLDPDDAPPRQPPPRQPPPNSSWRDGWQGWNREPPRPSAADRLRTPEAMHARAELGFNPGEPITAEAVSDRKRKLARKYHPDLAGRDDRLRKRNDEKMRRVNAAADVLEKALAP